MGQSRQLYERWLGNLLLLFMKSKLVAFEDRILVFVSHSGGASGVVSTLNRQGLAAERVLDVARLCEEIKRGAGAVILGEEVVENGWFATIASSMKDQPAWSDLPFILPVADGAEAWNRLGRFSDLACGGNITLIESPVREVSLVNATQVALRARRRQYDVRGLIEQREAILVSIRDPFIFLDRNLRFVFANDRAAEMRGCRREDLLGRSHLEVTPEIEESPYYRSLLRVVESGELNSVDHFDAVSGKWFEMRIYPSSAGVAVFGNDITDRKEAEEALRQSEERLRLMIEGAVEYVIFSTDRSGTITSWNRGAERILGYSESEIVGQPMDLIYTEDDRARGIPRQERERAQEKGQAEDERWHVRKDGSKLWTGGQVMPMVDAGGDVRGYVKILRDYTGRKRAESWLMALNETLEKRVAERTAEAEQRATQLQMLAGELTEAEERERRRLAELLHDHLQQILVAAKMQVGILNQRSLEPPVAEGLVQLDGLLKRSIEASRSLTVELSPPVLYDAGLGPAFHWLARRMLEDHRLVVSIEAEDEANPESESLRAFLFQAVRELLFNIVKHAGVNEASVKLSRLDGDIEAIVSDAGNGFDLSATRMMMQRKAFGLFSLAERVKLLGGSIEIASTPGEGTTVSVRVPLAQPERSNTRASAEAVLEQASADGEKKIRTPAVDEGKGRIRILLADDHKILREGLAGILREQSDFVVVSEASDGQMAVEMARETKPDVVIMDVSMPRLNGIEATRKISEEMPSIRIIALSMHAEEDMAGAMLEAGAMAYMTKGAPSENLAAAIRDVMKKEPDRNPRETT